MDDYAAAEEKDLGWNKYDCKLEIMVIIENIENSLTNLKHWMKDHQLDAPLSCAPSWNRIHYDPLGVVLIISAWNYPVFTMFEPLVSAIAAGNLAVLKPSEVSPSSSAAIRKMIETWMDKRYFRVLEGGAEVG